LGTPGKKKAPDTLQKQSGKKEWLKSKWDSHGGLLSAQAKNLGSERGKKTGSVPETISIIAKKKKRQNGRKENRAKKSNRQKTRKQKEASIRVTKSQSTMGLTKQNP